MKGAIEVQREDKWSASDHNLLCRFLAVNLLEFHSGDVFLYPPFFNRGLDAGFKLASLPYTFLPRYRRVGFNGHQGSHPFGVGEKLLMCGEHGTLSTDAVGKFLQPGVVEQTIIDVAVWCTWNGELPIVEAKVHDRFRVSTNDTAPPIRGESVEHRRPHVFVSG